MKRKVLVICSAGGHLCEARIALESIPDSELIYITNPLPHLKDNPAPNMQFIIDPHIHIFKYFLNFLSAIKIYLKYKPKVILTSGGGISIALFMLGKLLGATTIFIESGSRIRFPSKTGKLLYPFSDYFFIQSEKLLSFYPKAKFVKGL